MKFNKQHPFTLFLTTLAAVFVLAAFPFQAQSAGKQDKVSTAACRSGNGLHSVTFKTGNGEIRVNFPDDTSAGDEVSGTVVVEPAGKTEEIRRKNLGILNGYVVECAGQQTPAGKEWAKWTIPGVGELPIILRDRGGNVIARSIVPVRPAIPAKKILGYKFPEWGQAGNPIRIKGNFSGNLEDTDVYVGDQRLRKWAESPRQLVVGSPLDHVGPTHIRLTEGEYQAEGSYRNIAVEPAVAKTKLNRGEQTPLTVTVKGLEGLDHKLPLRVENKTPQIVDMEGGQAKTIIIDPADVTPGGIYTHQSMLTGVLPGDFRIRASIPIEDMSALEFIYPEDGEAIGSLNPTIEWTPVDISGVEYSLTVWHLPESLANKVEEGYTLTEGYLADLPPYFREEGITESSFTYPPGAANPLVPGTYAFAIGTLFGTTGPIICCYIPPEYLRFRWSDPVTEPDEEGNEVRGRTLTVKGDGYPEGTIVTITDAAGNVLGTDRVGPDKSFSETVFVPAGTDVTININGTIITKTCPNEDE